jgi:hypothetical protein
MATTPRRLLRQMLEEHGPLIADAFLEAVANSVNGASIKAVAEALGRSEYDVALDLLGLNEEAFETVAESVQTAYRGSGRAVSGWIEGASGAEVRLQFKPGDPVAADWLRKKSSRLVAQISETQRETVREALAAGMDKGLNPRTVALDVAGRIPKGANRRTGGIVGLTRNQARTVSRLRDDLMSGDPARMRSYLNLSLRDRRFDRTVSRAIKAGKGLTRAEVDRITGRYADKALKWRADAIARTEANQAFHAAQDHSFGQGISSGHIQPDQVEKTWHASRDDRVRFSHSVLNGQTVGMDDVFVSPMGSMMKHPGDTSLGAVPGDIIQCRCRMSYRMKQ